MKLSCMTSFIEVLSNFSIIVNEVIRGNFRLLYIFFYDKILQAQKVQKDA